MERETRPGQTVTPEFETLRHDPDLQAEPGPAGTLIFLDGDQYCCVGPDFVSMEEGGGHAFGATREEAVSNYMNRISRRQ